MVRIGILSDDKTGSVAIRAIRQYPELTIGGIARDFHFDWEPGAAPPNSFSALLQEVEALYVDASLPVGFPFLREVVRHSKHLCLSALPELRISEYKTLEKFALEAGNLVQINVPLLFAEQSITALQKLSQPNLAQIQFHAEGGGADGAALLQLALFILKVGKSEVKKNEVFGISGEKDQLAAHVRIEFQNNSVASALFTKMHHDTGFMANIYVPGKSPISVKHNFATHPGTCENDVPGALTQFVCALLGAPALMVTFGDLAQAASLVADIAEKLNLKEG